MARPYKKKEREEKKRLFLEALEESRGMITTSCERAGITKQTLCNWRNEDAEFASKIDDIKDKQKEWVQGKLMTAIENGNVASIMFFLKTQCGWRETKEVEISTKQAIDVEKELENIKNTLGEED